MANREEINESWEAQIIEKMDYMRGVLLDLFHKASESLEVQNQILNVQNEMRNVQEIAAAMSSSESTPSPDAASSPDSDAASSPDSDAASLHGPTSPPVAAPLREPTRPPVAASLRGPTSSSRFVKNIYSVFKNFEEKIDVSVCIFEVPNFVSSSKPEAYVPQLVGLGPYHHLRPQLQRLQTYKVTEAKRFGNEFEGENFQKLVGLVKLITGPSARGCYDRYLDMEDEELACILAIDGLFLFELLCCYTMDDKEAIMSKSDILAKLVNSSRKIRLDRNKTLRDVMMLENQIPILALKVTVIAEVEMIASQRENMEREKSLRELREAEMGPHAVTMVYEKIKAENLERVLKIVSGHFPRMMLDFCELVSPFKVLSDYPLYKALNHSHLLDLLYHLIVLKISPEKNTVEEKEEEKFIEDISKQVRREICYQYKSYSGRLHYETDQFLEAVQNIALPEMVNPIHVLRNLLALPWSETFSSIYSAATDRGPAADEALIPRASDLQKVGVKFKCEESPTSQIRIETIRFERGTPCFYLPSITLNVNSEVVIRNLLAYETMIKSESDPMIFNRYMKLMIALIKSGEDVGVLKEIIRFDSITENEVANLLNGMNKAIRSTVTPELDKEIAKVKDFYNNHWAVKADKCFKKWRWTALNWLKIFVVLLFFFLLAVQAVCTVYKCPRLSLKSNDSHLALKGLRGPPLGSYV